MRLFSDLLRVMAGSSSLLPAATWDHTSGGTVPFGCVHKERATAGMWGAHAVCAWMLVQVQETERRAQGYSGN